MTALQTEVHLFIFNTLPSHSKEALAKASRAIARYKCRIEGAENRQGNREVVANWQIEPISRPKLKRIASGIHRPALRGEMQQVRAEFEGSNLANYDYRFERERFDWDAELSLTEEVTPKRETRTLSLLDRKDHNNMLPDSLRADHRGAKRPTTRRGGEEFATSWRLVKGFSRRSDVVFERDQEALSLARPEAGAFVMVSLQRRKRSSTVNGNED